MRSAPLILALAATAAAPAIASAQLITPIAQNRSVSATSMSSHVSGATHADNPAPDVAPAGDFLQWYLRVDTFSQVFGDDGFSNSISGYSEQDGGWNGNDAITLQTMSLNGGGGGPGGYAASVTASNTFAYTFTVDQTLAYSLTGSFGGCPFTGTLTLTNGTAELESISSDCMTTPVFDETGTLQPGEYTLEFIAGGSVGYDNPVGMDGGNGGGAGGPQPLFDFQVSIPTCTADMNGDTIVDVFDLLAYLDLWFVADAGADIDGAAGVDVFDLLAYLDGWFAGC